jgi:leucyl aminopeptidase
MADLELTIVQQSHADITADFLIVPVGAGNDAGPIDATVGGVISAALKRGDFKGRKDEVLLLYPGGNIERVVLVGTGDAKDASLERVRRAVGCGVRQAEKIGATTVTASVDAFVPLSGGGTPETVASAIAEALVLAAWDYRDLKTVKEKEERRPVANAVLWHAAGPDDAVRRGAGHGDITGRAANFARGLANRPGKVATPTYLAERAREIADRFDM